MSIFKFNTSAGVRYRVDYRPEGRESRRSRKVFERRCEAEEYLAVLREKAKMNRVPGLRTCDFESTTFKDEAKHWFDLRREEVSPGYVKRVESIFREILPMFGDWTLDRFSASFLTEFRQKLKRAGRANATVNRWTDVITVILNFSARHRRIPFNPAQGFQKLKETRESMNFWEKEEALEFLRFADKKYPKGSPNRNVYVIYLLALNTGLRSGEIWGLMPCDLNTPGLMRVERQFERLTQKIRPTKGKKSRAVPCSLEIRQELLDIIREKNRGPRDTILTSPDGSSVNHDNFIKRYYLKDLKESGVRPIRFHDLRHTALTRMVASNIDLKTIQEIGGHQDIKTTMNYVHLVGSNIKKVPMMFDHREEELKEQNTNVIDLKSCRS